MIVLAESLWGHFSAANRTFNARKNDQGELARHWGRLFIILKTAIDQKIKKKIRVVGTFGEKLK